MSLIESSVQPFADSLAPRGAHQYPPHASYPGFPGSGYPAPPMGPYGYYPYPPYMMPPGPGSGPSSSNGTPAPGATANGSSGPSAPGGGATLNHGYPNQQAQSQQQQGQAQQHTSALNANMASAIAAAMGMPPPPPGMQPPGYPPFAAYPGYPPYAGYPGPSSHPSSQPGSQGHSQPNSGNSTPAVTPAPDGFSSAYPQQSQPHQPGNVVAPQPVQPMAHLAHAAAIEMERVEAERKSSSAEPKPAQAHHHQQQQQQQLPPNAYNAAAYPPYYYPYPPAGYMPMPGYPMIPPQAAPSQTSQNSHTPSQQALPESKQTSGETSSRGHAPSHESSQAPSSSHSHSNLNPNHHHGSSSSLASKNRKAAGGHQPYHYSGSTLGPGSSSSHHHGHYTPSAVDDFLRHAHDLNHPSHHHSSRYHRHSFAPYPQSAASSRHPSPDLSPRSNDRHSDEDLNSAPPLGTIPFEYTPSTSPVLGPLRGMSLRNPSRPTSPVHLPSLRYPTNSSGSIRPSPTQSPDYEHMPPPSLPILGGSSSAHHSHSHHHSALHHQSSSSGSASHGGHSAMSHHRSSHRAQPYGNSRASSRHASPDLGYGGSGSNKNVSSATPSLSAGTASHPATPDFPPTSHGSSSSHPKHGGSSGMEKSTGGPHGNDGKGTSLPPIAGMNLPAFSSSSYFPESRSQPGSRANTPPLSPDLGASSSRSEEAGHNQSVAAGSASAHGTSPHRSHISGFSMTPISFGQTYGSGSRSKPPSPAMEHR